MATLEQIQGSSLVPDFSPAINTALKVFGTGRERAKEAEEARLTSVVSGSEQALRPEERGADPLAGPTPEQQNEALMRLSALNPQAAQVIRQNLERNDRNALAQIALETEQSQKNAVFIQGAKDFAGKRQRILQVADDLRIQGKSVAPALRLMGLSEAKLNLEMQSRVTQLTDAKTLVEGVKAKEAKEKATAEKGAADIASKLLSNPETQVTEINNLIQLAQQNNNGEAVQAFTRLRDMDDAPRQAALVNMAGPGGGVTGFRDLKNAEGKIIGKENLATREKKFFTKAELGLGTPGKPTKGTTFRVKDKDGKISFETIVFDPNKSDEEQVRLASTQLPEGSEILDIAGETPEEKTARRIREAGGRRRAERMAEISTVAGLTGVQRRTERDFVNMDAALGMAENVPQLERNLVLLQRISTGGIDAGVLAAARILGVESGDQAELTFNLRTNVLKQLKPTFGAQFTEREGKLLAEIQASETKSTAGNIRLMKRGIEIYNRGIERGLRAAKRQGDDDLVLDIEEARKALTPLTDAGETPAPAAAPAAAAPAATPEQLRRLEALRKKQR